MANEEHLARRKQGMMAWKQWREANPDIRPDLRGAQLTEANFREANLREVDLRGAKLTEANFRKADLRGANLAEAYLAEANLRGADLTEADLRGAYLARADLTETNFHRADLHGAVLARTLAVQTNFEGANLTGCWVYGISAWNVNLVGAQQSDLIITRAAEPVITVDNLEVAQFIHLLTHNEKIREVIDTITSKAVLILGRFTEERKAVLDAIRDELRRCDYLPIMFDFHKPEGRNYIETVSTLAHMARFMIADLTDAKVVLQELERVVPSLPSVPVQPIIQAHTDINAVIIDFVGHQNFLEQLYVYQDIADVKENLRSKIIQPAEAQLTEIQVKRLQFLEQVRQITHR